MATHFKLTTSQGERCEHTNLYRWSGVQHLNGWCSGVESFVKDAATRAVVGRWLPCPNGSVNIALQRAIAA